MKYKKGIILTEMVVVITIITIILSVSLLGFRCIKKYEENIALDYISNAIVEFINYGKSYSRLNKKASRIIYFENENKFKLSNGIKTIKYLTIPTNIKVISMNQKSINIDFNGFSSSAFTLTLRNNSGKEKDITMVVGTNYVSIKE